MQPTLPTPQKKPHTKCTRVGLNSTSFYFGRLSRVLLHILDTEHNRPAHLTPRSVRIDRLQELRGNRVLLFLTPLVAVRGKRGANLFQRTQVFRPYPRVMREVTASPYANTTPSATSLSNTGLLYFSQALR